MPDRLPSIYNSRSDRTSTADRLEKLPASLSGTLQTSLRLTRSIGDGVRLIESRVVSSGTDSNVIELDSAVALSVGTLGRANSLVTTANSPLSRGNVLAADGAVEHLKRGERLVVRNLMAGFVDADKGEFAGLLDLAVNNAVRGCDVGVTCA